MRISIPGFKYFPLPSKLKYWSAMKNVQKEIDDVIKARESQVL